MCNFDFGIIFLFYYHIICTHPHDIREYIYVMDGYTYGCIPLAVSVVILPTAANILYADVHSDHLVATCTWAPSWWTSLLGKFSAYQEHHAHFCCGAEVRLFSTVEAYTGALFQLLLTPHLPHLL